MCEWGTDVLVRVKIAAGLSHTGLEYWKDVGIDACIAPLVSALQEAGVDMLSSCCGHGRVNGEIKLRDGTVIVIPVKPFAREEKAMTQQRANPYDLEAVHQQAREIPKGYFRCKKCDALVLPEQAGPHRELHVSSEAATKDGDA